MTADTNNHHHKEIEIGVKQIDISPIKPKTKQTEKPKPRSMRLFSTAARIDQPHAYTATFDCQNVKTSKCVAVTECANKKTIKYIMGENPITERTSDMYKKLFNGLMEHIRVTGAIP